MGSDISLELGSLAGYLEDRVRTLFGKDPDTIEWNARLRRRLTSAIEQARWIQCVGMAQPVPIQDIYQPLDLEQKRSTTTLMRLIETATSAIVFAGPGAGKSTLLNRLCVELLNNSKFTPFLFLLRSPGAPDDLTEFVTRLSNGDRRAISKRHTPILLVDGYDEVNETKRKIVSAALSQFKTTRCGTFFLTCRTFYDVIDLKASHYSLVRFGEEHQRGFIKAFATCYDVKLDADLLLKQLIDRRLQEFAEHPLLLTLICILKIGPLPELPNNSLGLLKRVFDTLTLRWDQQRGIARHSILPLDGEDRIKCLMRIAHEMQELTASAEQVETYARTFLLLAQRKSLDVRDVLRELAQWYGVLVPTEENQWQFVHRSIHDYLAARFWIESGTFRPDTNTKLDSRTAYAACLSPDATRTLVLALHDTT
jgi:hypothetical protein